VTSDGVATEMSQWRRGVIGDDDDRCWAPRGAKKWNKWYNEVWRVTEVLWAHFIGRRGERRGREVGGQQGRLILSIFDIEANGGEAKATRGGSPPHVEEISMGVWHDSCMGSDSGSSFITGAGGQG
jgi:hypothetical protein